MILSNLTKRIYNLKENLLSSKYELCIERMRYYTEAYKMYQDDLEIIKRAKALAHTLKNMTIFKYLSKISKASIATFLYF
ncbi:MAG: pyruvate formate lyase family protein [Promethearchaeota archaeon]